MATKLSPLDYYFFRRQRYSIELLLEFPRLIARKKLAAAIEAQRSLFPAAFSRINVLSDFEIELEPSVEPLPILNFEMHSRPNTQDPDVVRGLIYPIENREGQALVKFTLSNFEKQSYLGISFSHMIGDGFSFFTFLQSIAETCGDMGPMVAIQSDRSPLFVNNMTAKSLSEADFFSATGYLPMKSYASAQAFDLETFELTHAELEKNRREIRRASGAVVSNHDVMMAFIMQKYADRIPLGPNGELIIRCPVDFRKMMPQLGPIFFGNAVKDALAIFDPQSLARLAVAEIAQRIRRAIDDVNVVTVMQSMKTLNDFRMANGIGSFERVECPGLVVSNLSRMPFHILDFGSGPPSGVHPIQNPNFAVAMASPSGVSVSVKVPRSLCAVLEVSSQAC